MHLSFCVVVVVMGVCTCVYVCCVYVCLFLCVLLLGCSFLHLQELLNFIRDYLTKRLLKFCSFYVFFSFFFFFLIIIIIIILIPFLFFSQKRECVHTYKKKCYSKARLQEKTLTILFLILFFFVFFCCRLFFAEVIYVLLIE